MIATHPLALDVWQQLDETAGIGGQLAVETIRKRGLALGCQVIERTLAGQADPLAGRNLAGDDVARELMRDGAVTTLCGLTLSSGGGSRPSPTRWRLQLLSFCH